MHFLVLLSALVACAAGVPLNNTNTTQDGRIWGGRPAQMEHHPHQVALLNQWNYFCGGSIISSNWVVTSALCVRWTDAKQITVRAGSPFHASGGSTHSVLGGYYHIMFDEYTGDYDVALLRVDPPFQYSATVQNIALADSPVPAGTNVVVTGWGYNWMVGSPSPYLQEAIVETTEDYNCYEPNYGYYTDRMICTLSNCEGKGPCWDDGGGALTTLYCQRRLVGIVSPRNYYCGMYYYPSVYTKVSAVRDWIMGICSSEKVPNGITKYQEE